MCIMVPIFSFAELRFDRKYDSYLFLLNSGQLIFKYFFFQNYSSLSAYLNMISIWRVKFLCDPPINS